ncbi:MAG: flippase-like domain-containing protein [bacterium]|nr:flippase-like domain-containing protein [bacterium]
MISGTAKKIARLFFSCILLGYLLYKVNLSHTFSTIFSLPLSIVAASILLYLFSVWISSVKWRILLPRYTVSELAKIYMISIYYSLILPGQLAGEGAKGYYLIKQGDGRQVIASIIVDRITGLIGLLIVALGGTCFSRQIIVQNIACVLTVVTLFCILILSVLRIQKFFSIITGLFLFFGKRFPRLDGFSSHLVQILHDWREYLQEPVLLIKAVILGILFQLSGVFILTLMVWGIQIQTSFADLCWIYGIVSVAILIPLTIGGIGVREGTFIGFLSYLGVPSEKSLALSLSVFALQIFGALIGGIVEVRSGFKKK